MNYRIVDMDAFEIIGKSKKITTVDGKNFEEIPKFWAEANTNGLCEQLGDLAGELGLLGVCMDFDIEKEELTYVIGVQKKNCEFYSELNEIEIPATTWAIFESVGPMPGAIQDLWNYIFSKWFPETGYEHANAPELEVYLPGNPNDANYKCEVWIPIIKGE